MRPTPTACLWEKRIISFCDIILKFKVCQYGIVNGTENVVVNHINSWLCCPYSVISV